MTPDYQGKVRDLFNVGEDRLIICASDRLSAFDVVFHEKVPDKGKILNRVSTRWFEALRSSGLEERFEFEDHLLATDVSEFPEPFRDSSELKGRSVLVKRTKRIDFECIVRGYLAGSGYKQYLSTRSVSGVALPDGLRQADRLPRPIFTPTTKASIGDHDEPVSFDMMQESLGESAARLRDISIAIYEFAAAKMERVGILLCDTKFEFGFGENGQIVLIDEILTPDSSRYWDVASYKPGTNPPGYDKQFVRDYLETLDWNKQPPPPPLPDEVLSKTREIYERIAKQIEEALA